MTATDTNTIYVPAFLYVRLVLVNFAKKADGMWNGIYYILVVIIAVWSIFTGYGRGFMRQIGALLGVAFGIVAARMLAPAFVPTVDGWLLDGFTGFNRPFVSETLGCGLIYFVVSGIITLATWPLGKLMRVFGSGVLDSIGGALLRMFQWLIALSIVFNLIVDLSPAGELTRTSRLHDGNIVEGVLKIAPALMDFPGAEEVGYRQQLEDAKKIS